MGTGSEREHGIFSEKTPPLGACPPFQRQGGGSAQKMGQAPSQIVFFPIFPQKRRSQSPFLGYRVYRLSSLSFGFHDGHRDGRQSFGHAD